MGRPLNPFPFFSAWRRDDTSEAKLYGSIVAQARLPVFYQDVGVPDTLQGRFVVLSLQLFAVLHRLRAEGSAADRLAQLRDIIAQHLAEAARLEEVALHVDDQQRAFQRLPRRFGPNSRFRTGEDKGCSAQI